MANQPPPPDVTVPVYQGTQAMADVLTAMLIARQIDAVASHDHEVEGGTAIVEAVVRVRPDQADEARALIADVDARA